MIALALLAQLLMPPTPDSPVVGQLFAPEWVQPGSGSKAPFINVAAWPYFAACDGSTDDILALTAAVTALPSSGTIFLPNRRCRIRQIWFVNKPNLTIQGTGPQSEIFMDPVDPVANDRAVYVQGTFGARVTVTSASLAVGATTFTTNTTTGLVAGSVIELEQDDAGAGDVVFFDFAEVASVAGTTVTLTRPLRTAFPGYSTIFYRLYSNPLGGVVLRDFKITTAAAGGSGIVGLIIAQAQGVTVERVTVDAGKAFATYLTKDVTIRGCKQIRSTNQTSEFAASVDLKVLGNHFGSDMNTAGVALDLGTGFFDFSGNTIDGKNACINLTFNVHDGVVARNNCSYITGNGAGIAGRGAVRNVVAHNSLNGAVSAGNFGIDFGNSSGMTVNITTTGNLIAYNSIQGYAGQYNVFAAGDSYIIGNPGSSVVPGLLGLGTNAPNPPVTDLHVRATGGTWPTGLRLENQGVGRWDLLPSGTAWAHQWNGTTLWSESTTGFTNDAAGFKHKRGTAGCATAAAAGAACTTVVTWTTTFPDANYSARCEGRVITSGVPISGGLTAQAAASVTFQTVAGTAVAAQWTNIDCVAWHD